MRYVFALVTVLWCSTSPAQNLVKLQDITRLTDAKENALVGYGIVTGLVGTGDSRRSRSTFQSIKNILMRFGVNVPIEDVHSRNAAAVMITATLPAFAQRGDKLDINVTSMGDARSLVGGTLLLTHLTAADNKVYALAQGQISVGGFSYDFNGNLVQKNHPTAGFVSGGAIVEKSTDLSFLKDVNAIRFGLYDPNFSTAFLVVQAINRQFNKDLAYAQDAARIQVVVPDEYRNNIVSFVNQVQSILVAPETPARVVVNERTGTVVAGGDVVISPVTITHGDLNVSVKTEVAVSQPFLLNRPSENIRTETIRQSELTVEEDTSFHVSLPGNTSVAQLVSALNKVKASSRDVIIILQSIKRAGALHAELVVQ